MAGIDFCSALTVFFRCQFTIGWPTSLFPLFLSLWGTYSLRLECQLNPGSPKETYWRYQRGKHYFNVKRKKVIENTIVFVLSGMFSAGVLDIWW